jgi:hypothetical protein
MRRSWVIVFATLAAGCGSSFEAGDGGQDATASDGKVREASQDGSKDSPMDAGTDAPSWSPDCPATEAKTAGSCSVEGLQCEYGVAGAKPQYDVACDDVRLCMGGSWVDGRILPLSDCHPDMANSNQCPGVIVDDTPCTYDNGWCEYPTRVCICAPPLGGPAMIDASAGYTWSCNPTPKTCPMPPR